MRSDLKKCSVIKQNIDNELFVFYNFDIDNYIVLKIILT
jgi:hypothetical protein